MKIFANENLFEPIIDYLKARRYDVVSIMDAEISGITDDKVYQLACNEKRIIITTGWRKNKEVKNITVII